MRDVIVRWQRGWGVSRGLPDAEEVGGALRVHCRQKGREVEYVALDDEPAGLAALAGLVAAEESVTWLTVPTHDPARTGAALEAGGLILLRHSEMLMRSELRAEPAVALPAPYRLQVDRQGPVATVTVLDEAGEVGAHGMVGLAGTDAIVDKIATLPGHRRRGLASAVMAELSRIAAGNGATQGLLISSEEGRRLYTALGWQPVAHVLISTTPGNTYLF